MAAPPRTRAFPLFLAQASWKHQLPTSPPAEGGRSPPCRDSGGAVGAPAEDLCTDLNNLGALKFHTGDWAAAEPLFREAAGPSNIRRTI